MLQKRRIKIAEILLSQGYISEKQLLKAMVEQKRSGIDLTNILVDLGFVSREDLTNVLGEQIQLTHRKRLGEVLIDNGLITPEQIKTALKQQELTHKTLGETLIELNYIDENTILDVLSAQLDTQHVVLEHLTFNKNMLKIVSEEIIEEYKVVPLFLRHNSLTIAMADPTNLRTLDHLKFTTGKEIDPVIASEHSIEEFIEKLKNNELDEVEQDTAAMQELNLETIREEDIASLMEPEEYGEEIVDIVNVIVNQAVVDGASDVHVEGMNNHVRIRYRIDGILIEMKSLEAKYLRPIVSRLKILSGMDIAEKRKPQDGKFHIHHEGHEVDVRVSSFPIITRNRGITEKIVLRILDAKANRFSIKELGFSEAILKKYHNVIHRPNGLFLVTGPTGSGKSSTLYATLQHIYKPELNITTMEDPVEYTIEGICQGQINPKAGFDFANGMRSILRQDPDVIMVGEMRDSDTCEMAVQAALTGHMVFSTLHTNDAPSAFNRLIDMGIEPFLISSSIAGVMAQRLVRKVCPKCKEEYTPAQHILAHFNGELPDTLYHGKGCTICNGTGYLGRTALFELLIPDEIIYSMVMQRASTNDIKKYALEAGLYTTLREDGLVKVAMGETTLEEVILRTASDTADVIAQKVIEHDVI